MNLPNSEWQDDDRESLEAYSNLFTSIVLMFYPHFLDHEHTAITWVDGEMEVFSIGELHDGRWFAQAHGFVKRVASRAIAARTISEHIASKLLDGPDEEV